VKCACCKAHPTSAIAWSGWIEVRCCGHNSQHCQYHYPRSFLYILLPWNPFLYHLLSLLPIPNPFSPEREPPLLLPLFLTFPSLFSISTSSSSFLMLWNLYCLDYPRLTLSSPGATHSVCLAKGLELLVHALPVPSSICLSHFKQWAATRVMSLCDGIVGCNLGVWSFIWILVLKTLKFIWLCWVLIEHVTIEIVNYYHGTRNWY
jgi:hypothetical protein